MAKPEGPQASLIPERVQDPPAPQDPPDPPAAPAPYAPQVPQVLQEPTPHMSPLNWSHFKPKFSGKPDEDAEAHFLRMNNWMDTHRILG